MTFIKAERRAFRLRVFSQCINSTYVAATTRKVSHTREMRSSQVLRVIIFQQTGRRAAALAVPKDNVDSARKESNVANTARRHPIGGVALVCTPCSNCNRCRWVDCSSLILRGWQDRGVI